MQRPDLQGRLPDAVTSWLPNGESDADDEPTEPTNDDGDGAGSSRLPTLLTVGGLGIAAVGVGLRFLQRRADDASTDAPTYDSGLPGPDEDVAGGTVEIVDGAGSDESTESDAVDATDTDDSTDVTDSTAATDSTDAADAEVSEPAESSATGPDESVVGEAETGATESGSSDAGVTVETFAAERTGAVEDRPGGDEATATRAGPPRIAPLVGMAALVGMRLVVERLRKRNAA